MTETKDFLPLTSDVMFYEMFGREDSKEALAYILSCYTGADINWITDNMEYVNPRPPIQNAEYSYRFHTDIMVKLEDKIYNIECNRYFSNGLVNRNNAYIFNLYVLQFKKGAKNIDFEKAKKVIQININAYKENPLGIDYEIYTLTGERYNNKLFPNKLEIGVIYLELTLKKIYNKNVNELTGMEKIAKLVSSRNREDLDFMEDKELANKIATKAEELSDNEDVEFKFLSEEDERRLIQKDYLEQGIEQGIVKGSEQKQLDIVKKMLDDNVDIDIISKYTDLSKDEILKIKDDI